MRPFRRSAAGSPDVGSGPLVVVDAGARGGPVGLDALRSRAILHAFEPDAAAAAALAVLPGWRAVHVEPVALAEAPGEAILHVARHGALSSLLEPDLDTYDALVGHMRGHTAWRHGLEIVARRSVATTALDTWAADRGIPDIHFLKIDTQGSELDVLRGGERLFAARAVHVLQVEVSLHPFYRGQARFSEIDAWLAARGCALVDCRFFPERAGPVRSDGIGVWGEAPRWTLSADATYVASAPDHAEVVPSALILAQLGYGSTAASRLARLAGWPDGEIEAFLQRWAHPTRAERRRRALRDLVPPLVLDAWRRRGASARMPA